MFQQHKTFFIAFLLVSQFRKMYLFSHSYDISSDLPKMLPISDDKRIVFTTVGNTFAIRCPVDTKKNPTFIDWSKGRMDLYNKDSEGYTITEKGVLKIRKISKNNAGIYTCNATNGHGSISISITLIVEDPHRAPTDGQKNVNYSSFHSHTELLHSNKLEAPKIDKPQTLKFEEEIGTALSLQCSASGYPAPHIFWLKKGRKQTNQVEGPDVEIKKTRSRTRSQSSLILHKIHDSDSGIYRCIAKNNAGKDQVDFELNAVEPQHPPEISTLIPSDATIMAGHMAVFRCKGKSLRYLNLHIKWLKTIPADRMQLNRTFHLGSNYYRVLDTDEDPIITSNGGFQSELLIPNATTADSGTYVCLAVNDRGYRYKNASLKVVITPKMISSFLMSSTPSFTVFIVFTVVIIMAPIMFLLFLYCKSGCDHKLCLAEVSTGNEIQPPADKKIPVSDGTSKERSKPYIAKQNQETSKLISSHTTQIYDCSNGCSCSINK